MTISNSMVIVWLLYGYCVVQEGKKVVLRQIS